MNQDIEQGVRSALDQFQDFCLLQIIGAWFADAPDPALLIDEMLAKWEAITRERYEKAARQNAEATGIITIGGEWLDQVIEEAKKQIRTSLVRQIGEADLNSHHASGSVM
jgi:hypothetical protein